MEDSLYKEIILEHWKHPQHYGLILHPTVDITDYNPLCGDEIHLTAKIENGKVMDIGFENEGCVISRAAASILTEFVLGKTIEEVQRLPQEEFLAQLEITLAPNRLKCALLSYAALQKGLKNFNK